MEPCFDKKEGGSSRCAKYTRSSTGTDVHSQRLDVGIFEDDSRDAFAQRFVEAQPAAIEYHLIHILQEIFSSLVEIVSCVAYRSSDASKQTLWPFVFEDGANTVKDSAVKSWSVFLGLQFAL